MTGVSTTWGRAGRRTGGRTGRHCASRTPRLGRTAGHAWLRAAAVRPPQYGHRSTANRQYGQPQYGQPQYGQPQYGQPQYGAPTGYQPAPLHPGVVPLRPLSLGEIYDGAFRSIRANPRVMFGLPVLVIAIGSLFSLALSYVLLPRISGLFTGMFSDIQGGAMLESTYSGLVSSELAALPVTFVLTTVLTGLLTASVSRSVIGQRITVGETWRSYGRRSMTLILFSLAQEIVLALGWALVLTPAIAAAIGSNPGAAAGLALVGLPVGLVLSVWFAVRTLLVPPAYVLEGGRLWTSVARAWRLTRGYFWRLAGIYVLAVIIVSFIEQIISTPLSLLALIPAAQSSLFGVTLGVVAIGLGLVIQMTFLAPVVALLYIDVRMRSEGLDIELGRAAEAAA